MSLTLQSSLLYVLHKQWDLRLVQPVMGMVMSHMLSPYPPNSNNLYVLWQEYQHGVGGRKADCNFTRIEKGHKRVKYTSCNRKKVWDLVDKLIQAVHTADSAIDKIYSVYGAIYVTKVI
eukprot:5518666-Ditylum_brightwellii.AAC.1